jgi:hypothetical protein
MAVIMKIKEETRYEDRLAQGIAHRNRSGSPGGSGGDRGARTASVPGDSMKIAKGPKEADQKSPHLANLIRGTFSSGLTHSLPGGTAR